MVTCLTRSGCRLRLCAQLSAGLLLTVLAGCSASPPVSSAKVSSRAPLRLALLSTSDSSARNVLASVQSQPLYRQAQSACRAGQFRRAADLLAQLAVWPALSSEQVAFVQEQRALCLRDAGLPEERNKEAKQRRKEEKPPFLAPDAQRLTPEQADCGPRALLLVCAQMGVKTTLPQLRQLAGTSGKGTSVAGLQQAAEKLGLKAEGLQVSREALPEMEMPALAWVNGNHFIAVLEVRGRGEEGTARIHDPNQAQEETVSQERLLRLCSGYLLMMRR